MSIAAMVIVGIIGIVIIFGWLVDKLLDIMDGNPGDHF